MNEEQIYRRYVPLIEGQGTDTTKQDRLRLALSRGTPLYWLLDNATLRRVEHLSAQCDVIGDVRMQWVATGEGLRIVERPTIVRLDPEASDGLRSYLENGCVDYDAEEGEALRLRVVDPYDQDSVWEVLGPGDPFKAGLLPKWHEIRIDTVVAKEPGVPPPIRGADVERWLKDFLLRRYGDLGKVPLHPKGKQWPEKAEALEGWLSWQPVSTRRRASNPGKDGKNALKPFQRAWENVMRGRGHHRTRPDSKID